MAFEILGKVIDIAPVNQVSEKFRKREFVIEKKENAGTGTFVDYVKFQLVQDRCDLINESYMNEDVKVSFNIRGNRWERDGKVNYFTNLEAWRIERVAGSQPQTAPAQGAVQNNPPKTSFDNTSTEVNDLDDLPF